MFIFAEYYWNFWSSIIKEKFSILSKVLQLPVLFMEMRYFKSDLDFKNVVIIVFMAMSFVLKLLFLDFHEFSFEEFVIVFLLKLLNLT